MNPRTLFAAALAATLPLDVSAYPIPPQTVWDLSRNAEVIVLARVLRVRDADVSTVDLGDAPAGTSFGHLDAIAELQVLARLKGRVTDRLEVHHSPGMICPAPPHYEAGRTALVFLQSGPEGSYRTEGLSYGVRYLDAGEQKAVLRLVKQAVAASGTDDERRSWAVQAASTPSLRWDGLYEIDRGGDVVRSFYDRPDRHGRIALGEGELRKIARSFARHPPRDATLPMLLGLLAGFPDPSVDATAVALVDELLAEDEIPYWVDEALELVLERLGFGMTPVAPEQGDPLLGVNRPGAESRRERWYEMRGSLGPSVSLPPPGPRGPRGLGGETPP